MGRLVLYGVGGIVAIAAAIKLAMALLGMLFTVTWFVFLKLVPIILVGWFVLWLWRRWKRAPAV